MCASLTRAGLDCLLYSKTAALVTVPLAGGKPGIGLDYGKNGMDDLSKPRLTWFAQGMDGGNVILWAMFCWEISASIQFMWMLL